jgi:hypothetical protein
MVVLLGRITRALLALLTAVMFGSAAAWIVLAGLQYLPLPFALIVGVMAIFPAGISFLLVVAVVPWVLLGKDDTEG